MRISKFCMCVVTILGSLFYSSLAFGAVHFGISGNAKTDNLGLETHRSQSGKASVSFDMGSYFRLGVSALREMQQIEGYRNFSDDKDADPVEFNSRVVVDVYSLDLITVLYSGEIFTPFIFVGAALKNYEVATESEIAGIDESDAMTYGPVPNGGGGLAISLSRDFSLKLTYTMSPGVTFDPETKEGKRVLDQRTDVGISYRLE